MVAEIQTQQVANNFFFLDPKLKCAQAQEFDERLAALIIGQENAVRSMGICCVCISATMTSLLCKCNQGSSAAGGFN